jgi:hypothetical protein
MIEPHTTSTPMSTPLLSTKLYLPPRPNWVTRPRLLARLDSALLPGKRLILVSAPAGSGKTTLLAEWVAAHTGKDDQQKRQPDASQPSISNLLPPNLQLSPLNGLVIAG